ncbi:LPXTG cell wall anchor domain-containing protein [Sporosarcina jiandibaonis]
MQFHPKTATNGFNLLAIGLLFTAAGGILLVARNRKSEVIA